MEEAAGESDRLSRRLSESEARLSEALLAAASSEASAEVVEGDAEEKDAVIRGLREELERAKAESIELRAEIEGAAAGGVDAEAEDKDESAVLNGKIEEGRKDQKFGWITSLVARAPRPRAISTRPPALAATWRSG